MRAQSRSNNKISPLWGEQAGEARRRGLSGSRLFVTARDPNRRRGPPSGRFAAGLPPKGGDLFVRLAVTFLALATLAAAGARAGTIDEDMSLGSPKAPVTVIEYASPTCPHCAKFNAEVFPAFKKKWVDTGKVRYVLREAPIHQQIDPPVYLLARCAGPTKYFGVIDAMMRAQPEYLGQDTEEKFRAAYERTLFRIAGSVGIDEQQTVACATDRANIEAMRARVEREMDEYQVHFTPTFVVNGVKMTEETVDLAALDKAIGKALAPHGHARRRR
jgi:protein-disulfide isomerase